MSKTLRFDPPLVRALAAELHGRLAGRAAHPVPLFDRDRSVTLLLDRGDALRWELHPTRGWVTLGPRPDTLPARPLEARITRVSAPPDERLLRIDLVEGNRFRGAERALVVELHTNQWNALLVDRASRNILSVLRGRDAAERVLRPGEVYHPPARQDRRGRETAPPDQLRAWWSELFTAVPAEQRREALLQGWAEMSALNVDWVLGAGDAQSCFTRWWSLHTLEETAPVLLPPHQPYPLPLPGGQPAGSLLEAFAAAAAVPAEADPDARGDQLLAAAERRLAQVLRRVGSLRQEAADSVGGEAQRALGDLLLAHLDRVPAGVAQVVLPGFEGGEVTVPLDPSLRPHQNAEALYERARRMDRAAARMPELIERAEVEAARWRGALESLRAGECPPWVPAALQRGKPARQDQAPRVPYRSYRTSGGLEVRVGRGRADNDRLTFKHAAPDEVWLHARQVPGSHVVLRWSSADAPPARDLEEAAALAAWHSRARSSATVAVDWTRRRHVRKPRGAPPGRVSVLQAKTLFVAPADRAVDSGPGTVDSDSPSTQRRP